MSEQVSSIVARALSEDIGAGDVSASLLGEGVVSAEIIANQRQ
jgi:nicotinate-nucleotide pyrophosphorylase